MNRYNLSLITLMLLMVACRQQTNVKQLMDINKSLEYSNAVIQEGTRSIYYGLENKLRDPQSEMDASIWLPPATEIKKHTAEIKVVLENLKKELIDQSDSLTEPDAGLVKRLFITNGRGYDLFKKLAVFKDSLYAIFNIAQFANNSVRNAVLNRDIGRFKESIPLLSDYSDSLTENERALFATSWVNNNFGGSSTLMAMVVLNKIAVDVITTENRLTDYCNKQTIVLRCGVYDIFNAITFLNSSYVKQGQSIKVTAGIGAMNVASKPTITINGKVVKLNQDAAAIHNFIANGKPGKHIVPVKISFTKPDGSTATVLKNLEYIIAE